MSMHIFNQLAMDVYVCLCLSLSNGCVGGRDHALIEDASLGRDVFQFKYANISRRHFEISLMPGNNFKYGIRDLGSALGTFIR